MDVLTEPQHRALAFISSANLGGYAPSAHELGLWLSKSEPGRRGGYMASFGGGLAGAVRAVYGIAESTAEHLHEIEWIRESDSGGLRLTPLGRALLTSAEAEEDGHVEVVVLD